MAFKGIILENIILRLGDFLLGTQLIKQLKIQRTYNKFTEHQLADLQLIKLRHILIHATKTCQAYQNFKSLEQDPKKWLKKFPILSKSQISSDNDSFLSSIYKKNSLIKYETSGSSGVKTTIYVDKKEQSIFRSILINWWEWTGYYLGKPMVQTGISPERGFIKSVKDKLLSTIYIDAFGLNEKDIIKRLNLIKSNKKYTLGGFASSLFVISKVVEKNKIKCRFDNIISWGDKLFSHYEKSIEHILRAKVFENYACNEGIMIGQKKDLPYFYIYTPSTFVEIIDNEGNPVSDGEIGRVVVTKLDGFAMPLIRYDIGDLAIILPNDRYPKKRDFSFPLLEKVVGRNTDIIKTPEGINLIVHTFTGIFEFYPEISQFQILQEEEGSIRIHYIPTTLFYPEVLDKLAQDILNKTNSKMEIYWQKVNIIAPSKSGKPQLIINKLLDASLADTI
jgi:phenylacetate-CoA ligase